MSTVGWGTFPRLRILPRVLLMALSGIMVVLIAILQFYIPFMEDRLFEERRRNLSSVIEATHGVVKYFHEQATAGQITHAQAQERAVAVIKDMRYGDSGYVWIHDDDLRMVMHPTMPELDGQDLREYRYRDNNPMFREMARVLASKDTGFVSYRWPKPGQEEPLPKLSYLKRFDTWGWVLGSGVYVDDVEQAMTDLRQATIAAAVVLALFMMLLAGGIGVNITRRLSLVSDGLRKIAGAGGNIHSAGRISVTSRDEIGDLSSRFNQLLEFIHSLTRFRRSIDTMETQTAIYRQLARVYADELKLEQFRIYEGKPGDRDMVVVSQVGDWADEACGMPVAMPIGAAGKMQPRQIGESQLWVFGSYQSREQCEFFSFWLKADDNILGMVCLAINKDTSAAERDVAYERVSKARQYINETLPVLAARQLNERLRQSALTDPLTGLHNRRFLDESMAQLCARANRHGRSLGLLMCDLDNFKMINDRYGHQAGDMVLTEIARVLSAHVRESDLVIRMGGEEFLIVLEEVRPGEAADIAEAIRRRVEGHGGIQLPDAGELRLTISIGVSEYPVDSDDFEQVINFADEAAYTAKHQGRNRCWRHAVT